MQGPKIPAFNKTARSLTAEPENTFKLNKERKNIS